MIKDILIAIASITVVSVFGLIIKTIVNEQPIKNVLTRTNMFFALRYFTIILLMLLSFFFLSFNKWFVVSFCLLSISITLMICYDYTMRSFNRTIKKLETDMLIDKLADCDKYDYKQRKDLTKQIKEQMRS